MAEISKIKIPDGTEYDIKDKVARAYHQPIATKTYTNVIGTENSNQGGGFFYMSVRPTSFSGTRWRVKTRVRATVPGTASGAQYYNTDTVFEVWGCEATVFGYICDNKIQHTSYRPIYYNSVFITNNTGYTNGCSHWIGFNLHNSANPTNTSYKRTVTVDLLETENCTATMQDSLVTPDNIPSRSAHTNWYSSANSSYSNYDASSNGIKTSGDANTTTIHALYRSSGTFTALNTVYRYQLLLHTDENTLTPLNVVNNGRTNTSKAMLTDVEFDPFMPIYYYGTTTTVNAAAQIGAGSLYWHYAGVDIQYTINCGTTLIANKPLYLVVTPVGTSGKCTLSTTTQWTQELPDTADGKWYILLGRTYNTSNITLYEKHPVYMHDGTSVREVLPQDAIATTTTAGLMSASDKSRLDNMTMQKLVKKKVTITIPSGYTYWTYDDAWVTEDTDCYAHNLSMTGVNTTVSWEFGPGSVTFNLGGVQDSALSFEFGMIKTTDPGDTTSEPVARKKITVTIPAGSGVSSSFSYQDTWITADTDCYEHNLATKDLTTTVSWAFSAGYVSFTLGESLDHDLVFSFGMIK